MGVFWFGSVVFGVVMAVVLLLCGLSANGQQTLSVVPAMFVFGDSLGDVGNNNHLPFSILKANFPHNGIDYPGRKPTGRFSNGKNTVDFIGMNELMNELIIN